MAEKKKLMLPVDYAKFLDITPPAVTRKMKEGKVKVKVVKGRRYVVVD